MRTYCEVHSKSPFDKYSLNIFLEFDCPWLAGLRFCRAAKLLVERFRMAASFGRLDVDSWRSIRTMNGVRYETIWLVRSLLLE